MEVDLALLMLRVVVGLLLVGHGLQKVTHLLGGAGIDGGAAEFAGDGFIGGRLTAAAAGLSQVGAGILMAAGLLTPAACLAAAGVMTVALTVKWHHGLWVQHDGYEYPMVLIVISAALAIAGPGAYSVDALLGLDHPPLLVGLAAPVLGIASGLVMRLLLHRPSRATLPAKEH